MAIITSSTVFSTTNETGRGIIILNGWNSIVTITAVALIIFSLAIWLLLTEKDIFFCIFLARVKLLSGNFHGYVKKNKRIAHD